MSQTEAAWFAGFFDGEGSAGIWKGGGRGKRHVAYYLQISNTHHAALLRCVEYSGTGSVVVKGKKAAHHKQQYIWRVARQRDVVGLLKQLLPYLVVKRETAEAILAEWRDLSP